MKMIRNELDQGKKMMPDIVHENKILTVWFDAWKYEREEHLAVIPFLRTIRIALQESENSKIGKWQRVLSGLDLTLNAFVKSTKITYGIKDVISVETDFGKVADYRKSNGSIGDNVNILYYDANLFLEKAFNDVRTLEDGSIDDEFRIVVFIDDLDRCSPERALEVLESIKTFFDMEGFVFVVGMNYKTIGTLVKRKYAENPDITGSGYLSKIV
jgi:hypothetical protein